MIEIQRLKIRRREGGKEHEEGRRRRRRKGVREECVTGEGEVQRKE